MIPGVEKAADPNIIWPAFFTALPLIVATFTAAGVAILRARREGKKTRENTNRVGSELLESMAGLHDEVKTNHGKKAGEYIEMIGPLAVWADATTDSLNEVRTGLGLTPQDHPKWGA